jgi:hypothetical protein
VSAFCQDLYFLSDSRYISIFAERVFIMGMISALTTLLKGKALVTTVLGLTLVGGTTAALAATTPPGQSIVQNLTGVHATATPDHQNDDGDNNDDKESENNDKDDSKSCPGLPEAQQLATKFSLSTDSNSGSIQVICTLHDGTFQGTVNNEGVTTDHVLGYGEIDQLLTYAQSLAEKDNATLSDSNVESYVATALKNCGSTAVAVCVNANMPADDSNGSDNNNGHDSGKPTVTPTPHADGKPTSTPMPHGN